jgi:hypothetical protein
MVDRLGQRLVLCSLNTVNPNLTEADLKSLLIGTDLHNIILTQRQLDEVSTCWIANLSQGLTCHHNQ